MKNGVGVVCKKREYGKRDFVSKLPEKPIAMRVFACHGTESHMSKSSENGVGITTLWDVQRYWKNDRS